MSHCFTHWANLILALSLEETHNHSLTVINFIAVSVFPGGVNPAVVVSVNFKKAPLYFSSN